MPRFDPHFKLVTSPVFSPRVLTFIRFILGLFCLVSLIYIWIWYETDSRGADQFLPFFTNLSFIGLTFYFLVITYHTRKFNKHHKHHKEHKGYPLQKWPDALQYLQELLYTTVVTFPLLVVIAYWALVAPPDSLIGPGRTFSNVARHMLNAVFALFEIIFTNNKPMPWLHLPITILFLLGYVGVAYITHATQGYYTYPFFDPSRGAGRVAGYIIGVLAAQCVIFLIVYGIIALRQHIAGTATKPEDTLRSKLDTSEA